MPAYLDLATFKDLTVAPEENVDALEAIAPGWVDRQLAYWSKQIDARLTKRYETPFLDPFPEVVQGWLQRIVTVRCFLKRGVDPDDRQFDLIRADCDAALAEMKEAADSEAGLYELPLKSTSAKSGISKGGPYSYSEASPYVWTDVQAETAHCEDASGSGTRG